MIHAACVLVFNCTDDEILTISRKANPKDLGLPGGKVESDELPLTAALRELREETGIEIRQENVADECFIGEGNSGKEVLTALATVCKKVELKSSEEGLVAWAPAEQTCEGSFGAYNEELLKAFGKADAPKPTCNCKP